MSDSDSDSSPVSHSDIEALPSPPHSNIPPHRPSIPLYPLYATQPSHLYYYNHRRYYPDIFNLSWYSSFDHLPLGTHYEPIIGRAFSNGVIETIQTTLDGIQGLIEYLPGQSVIDFEKLLRDYLTIAETAVYSDYRNPTVYYLQQTPFSCLSRKSRNTSRSTTMGLSTIQNPTGHSRRTYTAYRERKRALLIFCLLLTITKANNESSTTTSTTATIITATTPKTLGPLSYCC